MDFDGDGRLDLVAATFAGSPTLARGSAEGFAQPQEILDRSGERIVLNRFWNRETEEWDSTQRCDVPGQTPNLGHCTSAIAFDWDSDGDLDLLLGDYLTGLVYLRRNEGEPGKPRFAPVNLPVPCTEGPLVIPGRIESLRALDWDGDGRLDLLCGSAEAEGSRSAPAGVYWVRDTGRAGEPRFEEPVALFTETRTLRPPPAQPFAGFYPDAGDLDGDGDLDLVVGAQGEWDEPARTLTAEETGRLAEIERELARIDAEIDALYERFEADMAGLEKASAEAEAVLAAHQAKVGPPAQRRMALSEEKEGLTFGRKQGFFVWWLERLE